MVVAAAVVPCVTVVSMGGAEGCGEVVIVAVVSGTPGGSIIVPVAGIVG